MIEYHSETSIITQTVEVEQNLQITTKVYIIEETVSYNNTDTKELDESDVYMFKSILENVQVDNDLMNKLLNMSYFKRIYLPFTLSSFVTPYNGLIGYLFMFSSFVLPYQMIDLEKESRKEYADLLQNVYDKNHDGLTHRLKGLARTILVIPGLVFTPIILLSATLALKNM